MNDDPDASVVFVLEGNRWVAHLVRFPIHRTTEMLCFEPLERKTLWWQESRGTVRPHPFTETCPKCFNNGDY
jgi:hypothetical protein